MRLLAAWTSAKEARSGLETGIGAAWISPETKVYSGNLYLKLYLLGPFGDRDAHHPPLEGAP